MHPLEDLSDYVDISAVVNPWQAAVVIVLIVVVLWWPSFLSWLSNRRVEKSLTKNNGGSSVKDQLDRLEQAQAEQGKKLDEHLVWSEGFVKDTADKLDAIRAETGKPKGPFRRR